MSDGSEFFVERTLFCGEGFGDFYPDSEDVVALVIRVHQVEPLLFQGDLLAVLQALRDLHRPLLALNRRHLLLRAQNRIKDRDAQLRDCTVSLSAED
jgi:hypothetical protein